VFVLASNGKDMKDIAISVLQKDKSES
jgi:hypothetical protein